MLEKYNLVFKQITKLKDLHLLAIRLILAYGFYNPAIMKWQNIGSIVDWFKDLGIPLPGLNAYLSASTEMAGVILLTLGLANRIISIPLIFIMIVAIVTVHLSNGFESGNNGFEIPVYYILLLLVILIYGAGKFSVDYLLRKKMDKKHTNLVDH
ncbi:MAG: DoxX family protein [Ignavibacteriales bacterium]|nr:DoxX family protein [Ignavibacteriales bacterium]